MGTHSITVEVDRTAIAREAICEGLRQAIGATCLNIQADAVLAINQGPKTGRIYRRKRQSAKGGYIEHQASAPGEAPATDTANLVGSINSDFSNIENLEAEVNVGAGYGPDLEFGTVKMAARPFMGPAAEKAAEALPEVVAAAINRELK